MVMSMTGFGRSTIKSADCAVIAEMKSVNHRFSEFQIRMPRQLIKMEDKIKKELSKYIQRGRVELFITVEGEGLTHRTLQVDWQLIDDFVGLMGQIAEKYGFSAKPDLKDLLQRPDFITIDESEEENSSLERLVLETVASAAARLYDMRRAEGQELKKDLLLLLSGLEQKLFQIKTRAPIVVEAYSQRLERRMKEMAAGVFNEDRLATEVAVFADKSDIHEECIRLESHIQQFRQALEHDGPVGRKLDFMIQEMNREVNTIGSKANDSMISSGVVELKTSLEKMREQVQNIE
ncbi:YicC/YloC family endoribonuclease [Pseudobacillus wudalianchiensis]|uniref:YicC family protein n=1 Tax=Pseudobacillus wudalianchiensis TaxID=1743143 RepID=A0A1B9AJ73_9BACI|nr:YicC/YloC family endoribonuclease [Bacillus wudalianchiensis]OCA83888.1 YicC family protein [Bacillus wudalianchiensis]